MKVAVYFLLILSCFAVGLSSYYLYQSISHPILFKEEIIEISGKCNLPAGLIASIINVESSYNKNAKSQKDAIGLMQIKLSTANYLNDLKSKSHISETELFVPNTNIKYGCEYLNYLFNKFENINTVLAAYNAGETNVRKWLKSGIYSSDGKILMYIPFAETRNYVKNVNKNLKYYKKIYKI